MNKEINKIIGKVMEVTGFHYDMVVNTLSLKEITDIYDEHTVMYLVKSEQCVSDEEVESMRKSGIIVPSNESLVERDAYLRLKKLEEVEEKFREKEAKFESETEKLKLKEQAKDLHAEVSDFIDEHNELYNGVKAELDEEKRKNEKLESIIHSLKLTINKLCEFYRDKK